MAESFFATLECELIDRRAFQTQAEARMAIFEYLEGWYNRSFSIQHRRSPCPPRRAILYARVSTAEQAASGLGIAAQLARCRAYAAARGIEAREVTENGVSGALAPAVRPVLGPVLAELAAGTADTLIVAKLDRLGRDVRDVLTFAEVAHVQGWSLVVLDLDIDTSTAGGKLVLTMFAALAEWERNVIAERTRAALAEKKRQGARLGRPVEVTRESAERIRELRAGGATLQAIADTLNGSGMLTPRGASWLPAGIARVLRSLDLDAQAAAAAARAAT